LKFADSTDVIAARGGWGCVRRWGWGAATELEVRFRFMIVKESPGSGRKMVAGLEQAMFLRDAVCGPWRQYGTPNLQLRFARCHDLRVAA